MFRRSEDADLGALDFDMDALGLALPVFVHMKFPTSQYQ